MKSKAMKMSAEIKTLDAKMKKAAVSNSSSSWLDLHNQYNKVYNELNRHLDTTEKKHPKKFDKWYYSIDDLF